jgi:hypothetical protein
VPRVAVSCSRSRRNVDNDNEAFGVNNRGQVVGIVETSTHDPNCTSLLHLAWIGEHFDSCSVSLAAIIRGSCRHCCALIRTCERDYERKVKRASGLVRSPSE